MESQLKSFSDMRFTSCSSCVNSYRACGLYDVVQCRYKSRCRLWSSAARKASWICNLLPICHANLCRKWDDQITASDASLSGIAVCTRYTDAENVAGLARCKEGWRFKVRDFTHPREKALGTHCSLDPFSDPNTVLPVDKAT